MYYKNSWLKKSSKMEDDFYKNSKMLGLVPVASPQKPKTFTFLGFFFYTKWSRHTEPIDPYPKNATKITQTDGIG